MSASRDFLFKFLFLMRDRKSGKSLNLPFAFLSAVMALEISCPKFLIVVSPKRILYDAGGMTLNCEKLSLIAGGKTSTPMRLHSLTIIPTVSTSPDSAVSTADIYMAEKLALR